MDDDTSTSKANSIANSKATSKQSLHKNTQSSTESDDQVSKIISTPYVFLTKPSNPIGVNRQLPGWNQSNTLGTEQTYSQNYWRRNETDWRIEDIYRIYERYSMLQIPILTRSETKYGKGYKIVIPSEEKEKSGEDVNKRHPKVIEMEKIRIQYNILQRIMQRDMALFKSGGAFAFLRFNDAPNLDDLKKEVKLTDKLELKAINLYSKKELKGKGADGIIRNDFGDITKYWFYLKNKDNKAEYYEVHPSRIVEDFHNPDGEHVNGFPEALGMLDLVDRMRDTGWILPEILYLRTAPPKKVSYKVTDKEASIAAAESVSNVISLDVLKAPFRETKGDIFDIDYDSNFNDIANGEWILEHMKDEMAAIYSMPRSEIFGTSGTITASKSDDLKYLRKLAAKQELYDSPFLYRLFKRLEDYNIIKDKTPFVIEWNPLYEHDLRDLSLIRYYEAQTGTLLTAMGWTFDFTENGMLDTNTLFFTGITNKEPQQTEKSPETPKDVTDLPGTKPTLNKDSSTYGLNRIREIEEETGIKILKNPLTETEEKQVLAGEKSFDEIIFKEELGVLIE